MKCTDHRDVCDTCKKYMAANRKHTFSIVPSVENKEYVIFPQMDVTCPYVRTESDEGGFLLSSKP